MRRVGASRCAAQFVRKALNKYVFDVPRFPLRTNLKETIAFFEEETKRREKKRSDRERKREKEEREREIEEDRGDRDNGSSAEVARTAVVAPKKGADGGSRQREGASRR
ncbi:hypothetical protein Scep_012882 [Stephania cephalantha]|uniref:Uncharacterized protein n=1 Tax=Stephania cephalantha TaxID=152367 RepID=A0AAP0JG85_9MAGN